MRQPYELSIAVRYLRTRSSHSFISFISGVSMIGIALALAIAATFYPALSAARQPPAEALRYE